MIKLSVEECKGIYEIIDQLSGCNPENVFAWDGTDDTNDPTTSAFVKLYSAIGKRIPDNLKV